MGKKSGLFQPWLVFALALEEDSGVTSFTERVVAEEANTKCAMKYSSTALGDQLQISLSTWIFLNKLVLTTAG